MKSVWMKTLAALGGIASALACIPGAAAPGPFPSGPVRIIIPYPAGGTTDSITRMVAEKLANRWGQPVLVENRPGAGGNIGAAQVARADADGYVLLSSPPGPLTINFNLYKDLNYDGRAFTPVAMVANMPNVLVAGPSFKGEEVAQLLQQARQEPGRFTFASQGSGSTSHLTGILFQSLTKTDMLHVPYSGSAPALTNMVGGGVDVMFDNITTTLPFYQAGRLKVLAVASKNRASSLPNVPTMAEAGVPGFESGTWVAFVAPPGTPADVVEVINAGVADAIRQPDIIEKFAALGAEPVGGSAAEVAAFLRQETEKWQQVIETAKVTTE